MRNSQESPLSILPRTGNESSMSVYSDSLTTVTIIEQVKRIKMAFPSLPAGFYDVLMERVKAKNFTDQRLIDAISHLIDTCRYPLPVIADIVSWDRQVRLYTYREVASMAYPEGNIFDEFKAVEVPGGARRYASVEDIRTYNLKMK